MAYFLFGEKLNYGRFPIVAINLGIIDKLSGVGFPVGKDKMEPPPCN